MNQSKPYVDKDGYAHQFVAAPRVDTPWKVCAGSKRHVSIPGVVKPIDAGSNDQQALIVLAVNAHDDLLAALERIAATANMQIEAGTDESEWPNVEIGPAMVQAVFAAIAKAQPPETT